MGLLPGAIAWRGALLLGYQSRSRLMRIWDGLTNVNSSPWPPGPGLSQTALMLNECERLGPLASGT